MRSLITKKDAWLIGGILALALAVHAFTGIIGTPRGLTAEVRKDGQVVLVLDLTQDGEYPLPGHPGINFVVKDGAAAFAQSDCPDRICINTGFLYRPGHTAVCLPNRVSLTVTGPRRGQDADVTAK
jgi:hypothetical protein